MRFFLSLLCILLLTAAASAREEAFSSSAASVDSSSISSRDFVPARKSSAANLSGLSSENKRPMSIGKRIVLQTTAGIAFGIAGGIAGANIALKTRPHYEKNTSDGFGNFQYLFSGFVYGWVIGVPLGVYTAGKHPLGWKEPLILGGTLFGSIIGSTACIIAGDAAITLFIPFTIIGSIALNHGTNSIIEDKEQQDIYNIHVPANNPEIKPTSLPSP